MRGRRDDGQAAALLVMVACVVFVAATMALATLGREITERSRAQSAADAVALAAVVHDRRAAEVIAARHDATLVSWNTESASDGQVITVVVRVGDSIATARATDRP